MAKPDPKTSAEKADRTPEKKATVVKMARITLLEGQSYSTADGSLTLKKKGKMEMPAAQAKQYEKNGRLNVEYYDAKPKPKKKAKPVSDD